MYAFIVCNFSQFRNDTEQQSECLTLITFRPIHLTGVMQYK